MRFKTFTLSLALGCVVQGLWAQSPTLQTKDKLPTVLLSAKHYSGDKVSTDTLTTPQAADSYTIEVKGRFNTGAGRGLDVCVNDATAVGFRVSMDATTLNWTNPVTSSTSLSSTDNTKTRTLRFAVADKKVNIYEDGYFINSHPLETINESVKEDIGDNINPEVIPAKYWGKSAKPSAASLGWFLVKNKKVTTDWTTKTVNSRFENSPSTQKVTNEDGTQFKGCFFLLRWDNTNQDGMHYAYEVELEANTTYRFSMDCAYWNNGTATTVTGGVSSDKTMGSMITTHTFQTFGKNNRQTLRHGSFTFTTTDAGKYYISFISDGSAGNGALFAIANLQLHKVTRTYYPRMVFGKAYADEADMDIDEVTFDGTGAYAPASTTGEPTVVNLADAGDVSKSYVFNTTFNVSGKSSLHLTGDTPYTNTNVSLTGDDAWLYYDYVKPSKVIANYLKDVTVNGQPAQADVNCRVAIWDNGAVVIPNGPDNDKKALVAYDGENFTGNSKEFDIETYHNSLGEWDNKIKSFKLKKGYMATLANNANGTGYSRVFIADDADIEMPTMPEGMENFVSFIRVFRWNWTSKKGKANEAGYGDKLNLTNNYNWNINGNTTADMEYVPIRQNLGWPSWNDINNKQDVTHLLGCNEPDRPDQSNATIDEVLQMWPEMLKSGLRIGSPAPSTIWAWKNENFFDKIDKLGYRCDFAAVHIYEENLNANSLKSRIKTYSDKANGRPVWITEWNNGANWTKESWPSGDRSYKPKNAEKQRKFFAETLPALDKDNLLERYFEYDWVEDCRKLVIGDTLTLAGKEYANHKAALAYSHIERPWEAWKICPPYLVQNLDDNFRNITVKWYDHNGETGKKYTLERKMDDEKDYTVVKEFYLDKDYKAGETVTFIEAIPCTKTAKYRVKALSYKDTESEYSDVLTFTRDAAAEAPVLKGEAISTSIIKLTWDKVDNAKTYRIERAESKDGEYKVIADNLTGTTYTDDSLKTATTYFYRAYSLNSSASRPVSEVLEMTTKSFTIPSAIENLHISGGDKSVSLRWQFAYDTYYRVSRADKADGEYKVIADSVVGTNFIDENLADGNTYYYKVQPYNAAGDGAESEILSATPGAGKYLHLAFDENEGTTSYDQWGPYDGVFYNKAAFAEGRNNGFAVKLTKNSKSYVELPKGAVNRLTDFTVSTWINVDGGKGRIFDFGSGTGTWMMLAAQNTGIKYKITCSKGTFDFTVPVTWTKDQWHHVVLTQKGNEMAIYFDGILAGTGNNEKEVCPKDLGETQQNWLGRSQWPNDAYSGHIYDDFRIYNFAATEEDVKKLYADEDIAPASADDPATSIKVEVVADDDAPMYNLSGQRVGKSYKGIVIKNGRKYFKLK